MMIDTLHVLFIEKNSANINIIISQIVMISLTVFDPKKVFTEVIKLNPAVLQWGFSTPICYVMALPPQ